MKVLVVLPFLLAAASASWAPITKYHGPEHIPVIHNGVPIETPEVQHAKSAHYAALAEAAAKASFSHDDHYDEHIDSGNYHSSYPISYDHSNNNYGYSIEHAAKEYTPIVEYEHEHEHAPISFSHSSHAIPVIGHDGKPLDTPEVEAAKALHFAAVHKALSQVSSHGIEHHYRKRRGLAYLAHEEHIPVISHVGVPEESVEILHAGAEHLASHAALSHSSSHGYSIHQTHAPVYGHHESHSHYIPVVDHDGHPLDTPEVELAKAQHIAAHHEALARNSVHGYAGHYSHEGPEDTYEVQHAKALHFAAHAAARAHHY